MMKLVIVAISHQIRGCSHNAGIPPLIIQSATGCSATINMRMVPISVRCKLKKCLNPVKEYSCNYHEKCIFPVHRPLNKYKKQDVKNTQSKKMPPHKLQGVFGFCPNGIHVSPFMPPYQYDQASTDFYAKTIIKLLNIKELQLVCPLFNDRFMFQGEHRELQ